ncbi:MAG: hypothetical protein FWG10_05290 [Eubacteriaceae bacterium]|nr:hypothetical protein [Eubacteriaceae bacterium]
MFHVKHLVYGFARKKTMSGIASRENTSLNQTGNWKSEFREYPARSA